MKQYFGWIVATLSSLTIAGCVGNQSGHTSSSSVGDTSHPLAERSPTEELEQACGAKGSLTSEAAVRIVRAPYLQQMTTTSLEVGWLSTVGSDEQIEVTRPDGSAVMVAPGENDKGTRATGDHQMWAKITGLEPDTVYCYTLRTAAGPLSERIGMRTAPPPTSTRTVRFLAFGDSGGGGADQFALLEQMKKFPYDLIIHTGDIAYDSGTLAEFEDNVFSVYSELFEHIPFFPAAGNHDYETLQGAPFRDVFSLPGDSDEKWYSYDYGPIHFVAIDTEADYATQAKWLDADLAATKQPWRVVYMHRPPYSSGEHGSDLKLRGLLAPVMEKHHVQLVLAGHDHDYERMKPQGGIQYLVTGGGGKGTRPVGSSSFTALSVDVIHMLDVEVGSDSLVVHAIDGVGKEFDSVVVPR